MLDIIKKLIVVLIFPCVIISCTFSQDGNKQKKESKLSEAQQSAMDVLTKLQMSSDEMNRLYSTFPNIEQPCYPADTSFEISQSELLFFMQQFISKHYQNLTPENQNQLAKSSVLMQEKYRVLHCAGNESKVTYEKGLPMSGTWVMPNILGRRDLILVW